MVYTRSFLSGQSRITCVYGTRQTYVAHYVLSLNGLLNEICVVLHLFVPQPLATDEELGKAGARHGGQLRRQEAAHPDPAQSAAVLGQPAATRVVPRHHHRFYTHDVAVTEKKEQKNNYWKDGWS